MLRKKIAGDKKESGDRIRWRSHEVTRIEAFSDAVFAFAITLLIVSLEVPKSIEELIAGMRGFLPFAFCFTLLFQVWMTQNVFFRRYGLHDDWVVILNGMLIFMVLFFVYPLKFLSNGMFLNTVTVRRPEHVTYLLYIYSGGFTCIYCLFGLMYWYAYRKREKLALTGSEAFETKTNIYRNFLAASVGVLSMGIASFGLRYAFYAGIVYVLLGPIIGFTHSRRATIHKRKFETTETATVETGERKGM